MKSLKDKSLASLIKEADDVFSKYIRQKHSIGGYCRCLTCGTKLTIAQAQCGHYIDRDQMTTRYEPMNCRPVCFHCNCIDPFHKSKFKREIEGILTPEGMNHLHAKSRSLAKFMRHELQEIIDSYKQKIKEL